MDMWVHSTEDGRIVRDQSAFWLKSSNSRRLCLDHMFRNLPWFPYKTFNFTPALAVLSTLITGALHLQARICQVWSKQLAFVQVAWARQLLLNLRKPDPLFPVAMVACVLREDNSPSWVLFNLHDCTVVYTIGTLRKCTHLEFFQSQTNRRLFFLSPNHIFCFDTSAEWS